MAELDHANAEGVQFRADAQGHRASTPVAKAIVGAALRAAVARPAAEALEGLQAEPNWRIRYPHYLKALTEAGALEPAGAIASAQAGLREIDRQVEFVREGTARDLDHAITRPRRRLDTIEVHGRSDDAPRPWSLPWQGRELQGNELRDTLDGWVRDGLCEPGHVEALQRVIDHPEWLDLSDRRLVLLGAGAQAGPLEWLARWRATIVAIDLPGEQRWREIAQTVARGNARLLAPSLHERAGMRDVVPDAGADLLVDTPEIAAWLASMPGPLDVASLAYADGERHLRLAIAMDAIVERLAELDPHTTRMVMATPTDAYVVPETTAAAVMQRWASRRWTARAGAVALRLASRGRWLVPHIGRLLVDAEDRRWGIVDALVPQQGPNYALAKRMQQWRAVVSRSAGQRVSFNVVPSTTTDSVLSNRALRAGFAGAHHFGVQAFAPATTHALAAALWVHDLRSDASVGDPSTPLEHPLELLTRTANHGGLWRLGYLPRSAMPLAALSGFARREARLGATTRPPALPR